MVSVDCYLNETTRHADVILPPPSHLQKSHFDIAFATLAVRNVANYSPPVFQRAAGELAEWDLLARFASVLGGGGWSESDAGLVDQLLYEQVVSGALRSSQKPEAVTRESIDAAVTQDSGPERLLDVMLRSGPFGDWFGADDGLSLDELRANPHGIDLGALEPRLPGALLTPSGRPEFQHPDLMADIDRLSEILHSETSHGLRLINRRTLRSNNSWMHNLEVLVKGKPRCTMQMHPDDAIRLGLSDGDRATVSSSAGMIEIPVVVDDIVRPGVVSIPHGWGHGVSGTRMSVAAANEGVNVNVLTPGAVVDPLSGTSQLVGFEVSVTSVEASSS
jgi:anaerobic selenocysteine-containing dehydrogenase